MRKCLDSTFLSDAIRGKPGALDSAERWIREGVELATTSVNAYEVELGIAREASARRRELMDANWQRLGRSLLQLPFDRAAAHLAASHQAKLLARGTPAGAFDLMVASIASVNSCDSIVTKDRGDLARIGLVPVESH